jgi:hypothetical protein
MVFFAKKAQLRRPTAWRTCARHGHLDPLPLVDRFDAAAGVAGGQLGG